MRLARILVDGVPKAVVVEDGIAYEAQGDWFVERPHRGRSLGPLSRFVCCHQWSDQARSWRSG